MSIFTICYLVLFSQVTLPDGEHTATQITLIQRYNDVDACHKAVEVTAKALNLNSEQRDNLGCVRIYKGDAKVWEA